MTRFLRTTLLCGLAIGASLPALAEDKPTPIGPKLQPYIGCINRLSERSYSSRALSLVVEAERADGARAHHLRALHDLRHGRLPEECREGR